MFALLAYAYTLYTPHAMFEFAVHSALYTFTRIHAVFFIPCIFLCGWLQLSLSSFFGDAASQP